jgi:hypothetical protein
MAIKKRTGNNTGQNSEKTVSEDKTKKHKFNDIEIKTFKDEVIEVLNILDKNGVDIYDSSRYGGMYLNTVKKPVGLRAKFKLSTTETTEAPKNLPNLIDFFRKNSKDK